MTWQQKSDLIQKDPVTCARNFEHMVQLFIKDVLKSGLVISMDAPYLGASPDGKVIDPGCSDPFGLSEVKCPETKYIVIPRMMLR